MRYVICLFILGVCAATAMADLPWTPQATVGENAAADGENRGYLPDVAVAQNGTAIAAWMVALRSTPMIKVHTARSTDSGATWGPPTPMMTQWTGPSPGEVFHTHIATDNLGNWMIVYYSASVGPILYSRSVDDGITWSVPAPVDASLPNYPGPQATLAADTNGNFIVAYSPTLTGMSVARWDSAQSKFVVFSPNLLMPGFTGQPVVPDLATNNQGDWLLAWRASRTVTLPDETTFSESKIAWSKSGDLGETWTPPALLVPDEPKWENLPKITADANGNWMVAYCDTTRFAPTPGTVVVRSTDNTATWSAPQPLAPGFTFSEIATDGAGTWVAVANKNMGMTDDSMISFVTTDSGETWTTLGLVGKGYFRSRIGTDGAGNWLAVSDGHLGSSYLGADILFATARIIPNTANLVVTQIHAPDGPIFGGRPLVFQLQLRNLGPEPATRVMLSDLFRGDFRPTGITTSMGESFIRSNTAFVQIPELPAGTMVDVTVDGTTREWTTGAGINARAVATAVEADPDSSDNVATDTVTLIQGQADLEIAVSPVVVGSSRGTSVLTWKYKVRNAGRGPSRPTVTRFYLSSDENLSSDDRLLKSMPQSSLSAGTGQDTRTVSVFIRRSVAPGSYVIGVVDANNTTNESDENNNTDAGVVTAP